MNCHAGRIAINRVGLILVEVNLTIREDKQIFYPVALSGCNLTNRMARQDGSILSKCQNPGTELLKFRDFEHKFVEGIEITNLRIPNHSFKSTLTHHPGDAPSMCVDGRESRTVSQLVVEVCAQ